MNRTWRTMVMVLAVGALGWTTVTAGAEPAENAKPVMIRAWKDDVIPLYDKPNGKVVHSKPSEELDVGPAQPAAPGWLRIEVAGRSYFVEASLARTDLKLVGKTACERLEAGPKVAATRGYGSAECEE